MNALLTDLYELTMAAGYFEAGKTAEKATFEMSIRRLPAHRNYVIAAGLHRIVDYLLNLQFTRDDLAYLQTLKQFQHASPAFWSYLGQFRFTGDVFAVPEGTPVFAGEPVVFVRAPVIEAQIPETYLLSAFTFESLVASKAARCVEAAKGRPVLEFGTRRAHTPEAGVLGGRAAYIGGCAATSNTLTGMQYGVPVAGTSAHAWIMSFSTELEAFRQLQRVLGEETVQLVDTYNSVEGVRKAASLGKPLLAVRLDSGDFVALSRAARQILDQAGLQDTKIMASGDLDEWKIRDLLAAGAPIDSFGVGTQLATSHDAPSMGLIYKMAEIEVHGIQRFTAKYADDKSSLPGAKQIFRSPGRDLLARSGECGNGEALLRPVILRGQLVESMPGVEAARERARVGLAALPQRFRDLEETDPYAVVQSTELRNLIEWTRRNRPQ